jgi:isoleucyl-tRNA synthetase
VAASVAAGDSIALQVEGEMVELAPQEVLVSTHPVAGLAVAADKQITVAVDAALTPELKAEGLAREVVRRVQAMRKDAGFDIADRITTYYTAGDELRAVFQAWGDYIMAETLSTRLVAGESPPDAYRETHTVDTLELTLAVQVNRAP